MDNGIKIRGIIVHDMFELFVKYPDIDKESIIDIYTRGVKLVYEINTTA